jgi:hypothetical protein
MMFRKQEFFLVFVLLGDVSLQTRCFSSHRKMFPGIVSPPKNGGNKPPSQGGPPTTGGNKPPL